MVKPDIERHRSRLKRKLAQKKLTPEEIERHCSSLPDRYLLNTPLKEMALHITLARAAVKHKAAIDFQDDKNRQHTRLTAVTIDRQGLLSEIAGTLYALDVNVHSAQVFTRADGVCLDILYVDCDGRSLAESKKDQVDLELTAVLEGSTTADRLLERLGKSAHSLPEGTSMALISSGSEAELVVEVRAPNLPGLLFALTKRFHHEGLSIRSAKVATWGHRIRDVFYLTDVSGYCKPDQKILDKLVKGLRSCEPDPV